MMERSLLQDLSMGCTLMKLYSAIFQIGKYEYDVETGADPGGAGGPGLGKNVAQAREWATL